MLPFSLTLKSTEMKLAMKKLEIIAAVIFISAGFTVSGQVSVSGTAYTEIVPLATVKEEVQMNLGKFATADEGGSVTILPDGTRLSSGSILLREGVTSQGVFVITGSETNSLNVLLPLTPVPLYHHNTSSAIYLDNWTKIINTKEFGSVKINIGATLKMKSVEVNPAGIYTGKYLVNILFN